LDVCSPLGWVESINLQCSISAQVLDLIDELVAAVVAGTRVALTILVSQATSHGFHDEGVGEVFRSNQLDTSKLSCLFALDVVVQFWIVLLKTLVLNRQLASNILVVEHVGAEHAAWCCTKHSFREHLGFVVRV